MVDCIWEEVLINVVFPLQGALLNAPDAMEGYQNVVLDEAKGRYKNEVCARVALVSWAGWQRR